MAENLFKKTFKYYKQKEPPPAFHEVINPGDSEDWVHFTKLNLPKNLESVPRQINNQEQWTVLSSKLNPGFVMILNAFSPSHQLYWIRQCVMKYSSSKFRRNIDGQVNVEDWFTEAQKDTKLIDKLRWSTLGYHHNWDTKEYSEANKGLFPEDLAEVSRYIAQCLQHHNYKAEAGIVNYYPVNSTLSGHTDHSEHNLSAPLISISLGQSAIFLLGGETLETKANPYLLTSGSVAVMNEGSRLCYHAVPRIVCDMDTKRLFDKFQTSEEEKTTNEDFDFVQSYVSNHRINLNIRQVN